MFKDKVSERTASEWDTETIESFAADYRRRMELLTDHLKSLRKDDERYDRRIEHLEGRVKELEGIIEGMRIEAGLLDRAKLTL